MNQNSDFPNGFIVKPKHGNAPDYVMCKVSIKVDEFIQCLQANNKQGWCNLELLISKDGKPYAKFDRWEHKQRSGMKQPTPADWNPPPSAPAYAPPQQHGTTQHGEPIYGDDSMPSVPS